mmetsp:Transcript_22360/g.48582  ORF Transcript_22360/g.48582 Transcript_22360/m.48582 type:complete len:221 (+) Transcript_22360:379-1041(+)
MLHHIAHIHIRLSNTRIRHVKNSLDVLKSKPITLHALKGLCTTDKSLDILRIHLKHGSTILNNTVKIGNLFVASCTVRMSLHGQITLLLPPTLQPLNTLGIMINRHLKIRILVSIIPPLLVHLIRRKVRLTLSLHTLKLGLHTRHHTFNVWISRIHPRSKFKGFVRPPNIPVGHLFIAFANVGCHGLSALELREVLLHLFQIGIARVHGESTLECFDTSL